MKKLIKRLLENNLSLKIASIIIAFILWFWVTNLDDPIIVRNFNDVPVTITNGSYLESLGLTCILSETEDVKVSIEGNRSVVDSIALADIVVVADLTQIVSMDSNPVMVPITATCTKYPNLSSNNITTYPGNIALDVEALKSESFVVTPTTDGTKPTKEYEVGSMEAALDSITITGPESIVNKIDKVVSKVNVTGLSESKTLSGSIVIYDKNQDIVSDNQLAYLKMKELPEARTVDVDVELWRLVTGVKIEVGAIGVPKAGYQIGEVTAVPAEISVVGSENALEFLREQFNTIVIPDREINANNKSEDFTTKIDINEFLPDDIRLATDVSSTVLVSVQILPDGSQAFEVPISNITQENLGKDLMVSYDTDSIEVRVKGTAAVLNRLSGSDITGTIDLEDMIPGQYTVPVNIALPTGLLLVSNVNVDITIAETEVVSTVPEAE